MVVKTSNPTPLRFLSSNPVKITNFGTVTGEAAPDLGDTETYTLTGLDTSNGADDIVYDWRSDGGAIQGDTNGESVDVEWGSGGNWKVSCNISSDKAEVKGQAAAPLNVFVDDGSSTDDKKVITDVQVSSGGTVFNGQPASFTADYSLEGGSDASATGSATWTVSPDDGVTITGQGNTTAQLTFPTPGTVYEVTAEVVVTNSAGPSDPFSGNTNVTVNKTEVVVALSPASDDDKYVLTGAFVGDNATITVNENDLLTINNVSSGHPVHIVTAAGADDVATNAVTEGTIGGDGQGATGPDGTISWNTTGVTPGTYYYQCEEHDSAGGEIVVVTA